MLRPINLTDSGTVSANSTKALPPNGSLATKLAALRNTPSGMKLRSLVADPLAWKRMVEQVFGQDISPQRSEALRRRLLSAEQSGDWSFIDVRAVKDSNPLVSGASAAYSGGDDRVDDVIFLALSTTKNVQTLEMPFFEELGHWIDDQLRDGGGDAIGDEGERFAARLAGKQVGEHALTEDDRRLIRTPNGFTFTAENAVPVPTDAQHLAGLYALKEAWSKPPANGTGLDFSEFKKALGTGGKLNVYRNLFSSKAFEFWLVQANWKKLTGGDNVLALTELNSMIKYREPAEAARLRANYELLDNWSSVAGPDEEVSRADLLAAFGPGSPFFKATAQPVRDGIDQVFVFWFYNLTGPLTKSVVQSKVRDLQPSPNELKEALTLLRDNWNLIVGFNDGVSGPELRTAMSEGSRFHNKMRELSKAPLMASAVEYWLQHHQAFFVNDSVLTKPELDKKIGPPRPSDAQILAGLYALRNAWDKLPTKSLVNLPSNSKVGLDFKEFVTGITFPNGALLSDYNAFSGPALLFWAHELNWNNFAGGGPEFVLTKAELDNRIKSLAPTEGELLRANYKLHDNWTLVSRDGRLERAEVLAAMVPGSVLHGKTTGPERAVIEKVFVHWHYNWGSNAPINKKAVESKISKLEPSRELQQAVLKTVVRPYWGDLIGKNSPGLTPVELRAAMSPGSAFYKRISSPFGKDVLRTFEYWLRNSVAFFGSDRVLLLNDVIQKIDAPRPSRDTLVWAWSHLIRNWRNVSEGNDGMTLEEFNRNTQTPSFVSAFTENQKKQFAEFRSYYTKGWRDLTGEGSGSVLSFSAAVSRRDLIKPPVFVEVFLAGDDAGNQNLDFLFGDQVLEFEYQDEWTGDYVIYDPVLDFQVTDATSLAGRFRLSLPEGMGGTLRVAAPSMVSPPVVGEWSNLPADQAFKATGVIEVELKIDPRVNGVVEKLVIDGKRAASKEVTLTGGRRSQEHTFAFVLDETNRTYLDVALEAQDALRVDAEKAIGLLKLPDAATLTVSDALDNAMSAASTFRDLAAEFESKKKAMVDAIEALAKQEAISPLLYYKRVRDAYEVLNGLELELAETAKTFAEYYDAKLASAISDAEEQKAKAMLNLIISIVFSAVSLADAAAAGYFALKTLSVYRGNAFNLKRKEEGEERARDAAWNSTRESLEGQTQTHRDRFEELERKIRSDGDFGVTVDGGSDTQKKIDAYLTDLKRIAGNDAVLLRLYNAEKARVEARWKWDENEYKLKVGWSVLARGGASFASAAVPLGLLDVPAFIANRDKQTHLTTDDQDRLERAWTEAFGKLDGLVLTVVNQLPWTDIEVVHYRELPDNVYQNMSGPAKEGYLRTRYHKREEGPPGDRYDVWYLQGSKEAV